MAVEQLTESRQSLVERYRPLAFKMARDFARGKPKHLLTALYDAAVDGLMRAGLNLDNDEGVCFCRYARKCIASELQRAVARQGPRGFIYKAWEAPKRVSIRSDAAAQKGERGRGADLNHTREFVDRSRPEGPVIDDRELVHVLLDCLNPVERKVAVRYVTGWSHDQMRAGMEVSRQRITQIWEDCRRKMAARAAEMGLEPDEALLVPLRDVTRAVKGRVRR
jgi:DNA-directed RNA polymerase specialized sigma subunit